MGFADELLAQTDAANKDGHLDDALAAFKQLEQVDMKGFKELGQYHQARVLEAKGDKAKAIELLKDVQKRVSRAGQRAPVLVPGVRRGRPAARARPDGASAQGAQEPAARAGQGRGPGVST